jgi:hypothetical protein
MFPFVLYECETWSVTLREEHWLMVFESRVLRTVFRPKKDKVKGDCGKLHNEELYNLCCLTNIIRVIQPARLRQTGHVARVGDRRSA